MDVNGTKYHLLYGCEDWEQCEQNGDILKESWSGNAHAPLAWDCASASLRLAREVRLFRHAKDNAPPSLQARRGAGRDNCGNWYWIDESESGIRFLPTGSSTSVQFWTAAQRNQEPVSANAGTFIVCQPASPSSLVLRGLVVTPHRYLVVGNVTERGLLLFDLSLGSPPQLLLWPADVDFIPWDLALTPSGSVLILDKEHKVYWVLDEYFRVQAERVGKDVSFQPVDKNVSTVRFSAHPHGYSLPAERGIPVSIEPGPHGHVLILYSSTPDYSTIGEYDGANEVGAYQMQNAVTAIDPRSNENPTLQFSVLGHDFAYIESTNGTQSVERIGCDCQDIASASNPTHSIYVADQKGMQVFAFIMDRTHTKLIDQHDFLPLRRWSGKGIIAANGQVYYDFGGQWTPLHALTDCHYATTGVITTPTPFLVDTTLPGVPFDSIIPGCTWHRLFLDAQIPQGAAIHIRARAADDPELLLQTAWSQQPDLYLRSDGAELPYYNPWADMQPFPEYTGTWELLLQEIYGRYLQLELTFQGNGRSTPALRALRAWYPRFSYLDHYLPAIYREDLESASFLERWLANFEGFYTNLEDKIEQVAELFDPRAAPADTLDWLASWFGVVLDPLWDEDRRRFFLRHIDTFYRQRGTLPGLEMAIHLYLDAKVDETLLHPTWSGRQNVRIAESFLTRGPGGLAYGAVENGVQQFISLTPEIVANNAHRFSVLVAHDLNEEQITMLQRIVELAKPAHTAFEIMRSWHFFRVGTAQLGLDTYLADSDLFTPLQLGGAYLADNYLATDQMV